MPIRDSRVEWLNTFLQMAFWCDSDHVVQQMVEAFYDNVS